jgi:hypothetical protein
MLLCMTDGAEALQNLIKLQVMAVALFGVAGMNTVLNVEQCALHARKTLIGILFLFLILYSAVGGKCDFLLNPKTPNTET